MVSGAVFVKSIVINGFRGVREGRLDGFVGINILVGRNNTGKSTVLEALYLAATGCYNDMLERLVLEYVVKRRGWYGRTSIDSLFYMYVGSCSIVLETDVGKQSLVLERSVPIVADIEVLRSRGLDVSSLYVVKSSALGTVNKVIHHYFDSKGRYARIAEGSDERVVKSSVMLLDWYAIERAGGLEDLYSLMRIYGGADAKRMVLDVVRESYDVEDIEILRYGNRWVLHADFRSRSLPAHVMGDGFKLALAYLMLLAVASNAVLLLEEPELHMHPGLLRLIARAIVKSYRERRCQVVLSTHSLELIDMLLDEAEKHGLSGNELKVFRLGLENGELMYEEYSMEEAREAREKLEWDLRL